MTKKQKSFFEAARVVSTMSNFDRVHIGCVITDGSHRIISSASNSNKTHPLQKKLNKERFALDTHHSLHAEVSALLPLMKDGIDFSKVEIYTHRNCKDGQLAMARPCQSCMKLIKQLGIRKIWYTTPDGYACEYVN